jgi:hypothetical protein
MKDSKNLTSPGVILTSGLSSWQILQQDDSGTATLNLKGTWSAPAPHGKARVMVRILDERELLPVARDLDWRAARTDPKGSWQIKISGVPRGGLYRLETALCIDEKPIEWALRGDMVHHWGVGDVWLIAGQSNAAGYGKSPASDGPQLGVHMFAASGAWRLASHPLGDSTGTRFPLNRETGNSSHSPFLAFGRQLMASLGYPIGLIPTALGGSPIARWTPPRGDLYSNMLAYLEASGGGCRGVLWYQGESDTGAAQREKYPDAFRRLVSALRKKLRTPTLPILTAQLNRYVGDPDQSPAHANWEAMREIQRQLGRTIPGVFLIPTSDIGLSDGIHNNSSGNLVIGSRFARTALGGVYGHSVKFRAPDLHKIVRLSPTEIELHFENVDERLDFGVNSRRLWPFSVSDAAGPVELTACQVGTNSSLRLQLARPLNGRALITGANTACPPIMLPIDTAGFWPILAFQVEI